MIPDHLKNNTEWLKSWSDVWPVVRRGLNDRLLAESAMGARNSDHTWQVARQQCVAELIQQLDQVGTVQPDLNRVGPKPLNPVY